MALNGESRIMKVIIKSIFLVLFATLTFAQNPQSEFINIADDHWHFETAISRVPFIPFGVNYYDPATFHSDPFPAYDVIGQFDSIRTDRHFSQLEGVGANIVRIFLSVSSFEPALFNLNEESFHKVDTIIQLAKSHNLRIIFDLVEFWEGTPDWMSWEYYADESTLQGLEFLVSAFAARYANEPTIFAWDLINEPHTRWSDGIMDQLWIEWVHRKYLTEDSLKTVWLDYPRFGETWNNIRVPEESINNLYDPRLFDFQLFREDVAYNWTRRLVQAIREVDQNHLITIGLIQWSVPLKKSRENPGGYPAFNPQKLVSLLDYISIHGYNWWDQHVGTYIQGLLRYCYVKKPVLLEEFEYRSSTVEATQGSASGWLSWAAYQGPLDPNPEAFLFDVNENLTPSGSAFQQKASDITNQIPERQPDAAVLDADLDFLLTDASSSDSLYYRYVELQQSVGGPVGFNVQNLQPPVTQKPDDNLLHNPGFEQFMDPSGVADYWIFWSGDHVTTISPSAEAKEGQHSQRIDIQTIVGNSYVILTEPQSLVRLTGNTEYELSFWAKGRGRIVPSVILNSYNFVKWGEITTLTDSWQRLEVSFKTPDLVTDIDELIRFADTGNFGNVRLGDWVLIDDAVLSVVLTTNDITINLN